MKKIILVSLMFSFLTASAQKLDSLALEAIYGRAEQFFIKGKKDSALIVLDTLAEESLKSEIFSMYVHTLLAQVNVNRNLRQYEKAKSAGKNLHLVSKKELNPKDFIFLDIYNSLAGLSHDIGDYGERDNFVQKAKNWYQKNKDKGKYTAPYANILINIGVMAIDGGDFYKAIDYHEQALDLIHDNNSSDYYIRQIMRKCYENIGTAYVGLKEYQKGLKSFKNAKDFHEKNNFQDHGYINILERRMSYAYLKKGDLDEAIKLCNKILARPETYLSNQQKEFDEAWLYHTLGQCYTQKSDFGQAEELFKKAIQLRKNFYLKYQNYQKHEEIGSTIFRLAEMQRKSGLLEQALKNVQKALIQYCIEFSDTSFLENPTLDDLKVTAFYLTEILRAKAELLEEIGNNKGQKDLLKASLDSYGLLISLIDRDRQRYKAERSKIFLLSEAKPAFEGAIFLALSLFQETQELKYAEMAFQFAEKSKAVLLYESFKETEAKHSALLPDSLLSKEQQLQRSWNLLKEKIYQLSNKAEVQDSIIKAYKKQAFEIKREIDELKERLEMEYPRYFEIKYFGDGLSIQDIQTQLREEDRQLIEFFSGDNFLFIFKIAPESFSFQILDRNQAFDQSLKQILDDLQGLNPLDRDSFLAHSSNIYKQLFSRLELDKGPKKLSIISDGLLGYLPFEILSTQVNKTSYFIKHYDISYAYSAKLLYKNPISRIKRPEPQMSWLGFAPDYSGDEYLAFNKEEVEKVNLLFKGSTLVGEDALEENFLQEAKEYSMIHFAMHAYMDLENPQYSYLAFQKDSSNEINGKLFYYEIFNQELNSDLVALSACNTGYGPLVKGEGIMSLARAFRYAGCSSVLMNLWKTDGAISSTLMESFYANLKKGLNKDEALRLAKLQYLETAPPNRQSPKYWANLVLIGEHKPIRNSKDYLWLIISLGALSVLGIFFQIRKKQKI